MPSTAEEARHKLPAAGREVDLETDAVTIPVKLCNLPPFNAIATQVLALTADPNADIKQISKLIEGDPAFAADVLFLANSSLFGFPSCMQVLRHAIALLGLDRIKALAVTVAMRGFVGHKSPLVHQCWRHSVACALVCEALSEPYDLSRGRAYTAGIMHDIGRLGLLKTYPREMGQILGAEYSDLEEVLRAERAALNVDHARAGSWLIESWMLPETFAHVCARHHERPGADDSKSLHLVKTACAIASAIGFSDVNCRIQPSFLDAVAPIASRLGRKAIPQEEDLRARVSVGLAAFVD